MTTPQRPILGSDVAQPLNASVPDARSSRTPAPETLIAKELPPWDLVPSDLLLVRRRAVKK